MERLQKILARAGIASRRRCEELIRDGRVTVDGQTITELGFKADPQQATILFDGQPISREQKVYILLNKPTGYVTTLSDPQGRPIVTDLLPEVKERVFPVGRLDVDTQGALLLTNDGRLSQYILHPSNEVTKTYVALVKGIPGRAGLAKLERGIIIEGKKTWPARVKIVRRQANNATLELIIHEGRKRQVRKMLSAIGHPVISLTRIAYGNLHLGKLPSGKYRLLTLTDLKKIFFGKIPFTINRIPD